MILQEGKMLQNASHFLAKITVRLSKLSEQKFQFAMNLNWRIDQLYEELIQAFNKQSISAKKFSQRFTMNESYLSQVLFQQHRETINYLTPQRLCNYLKIRSKSPRKNQSNNLVTCQQIKKFVSIVRSQIQILAETRQFFVQHVQKVEKIFEQIDFFDNQYIDSTSLAQFFRHYSPDKEFNQVGCGLIIKMIKGSEFSNNKFFIQDLMEFIEKKYRKGQPQFSYFKNKTVESENDDQLEQDPIIQNIYESVRQNYNSNLRQDKNQMPLSRLKPKQSRSDQSRQQQSAYDSKFMELSMSQSNLSPKSMKNKSDPMIDSIFNNISSRLTQKNPNSQDQFPTLNQKEEFEVKTGNISNQMDFIKIQSNYKIKENSKEVTQQKTKEKFSILQQQPFHVKFKGFHQQKSETSLNPNLKQQHPKTTGTITKNTFQTTLMKSHSRNSSYLAQVKLISNNIPKVLQQHRESKPKQQYKHIDRGCLSGKISVFQKKKIEFIYSLQMLSAEFEKWYCSIVDLISLNEKFNFTNAFNVIDVKQNNKVKFSQFVEFLQECQIEKTLSKVQVFFNCFSKEKSQNCQQNVSNKQNIEHTRYSFSQLKCSTNLASQKRIMRFSNFLKIFYLKKTLPLTIKCKQRSAKIQMRWDDRIRQSYCNFFRIVIDAVCSIQKIKQGVKRTYLQMKEVWNEQTFQKIFGRQIIHFEEMEKILGKDCSTFLCQLSNDDEYIDQQKMLRFLCLDSNQIY